MTVPREFRDVLIALIVVAGSATGLIAATPLWWPIVLLLAVCLGAGAVAFDIVAFDRPVSLHSRGGRWTVGTMGILAVLSALALAFTLGTQVDRDPVEYPFLVTDSAGYMTPLKSVPYEKASTDHVLTAGDSVLVECYVDQQDGRWFKLTGSQGWLHDDEVFAAPHTGLGNPPKCPD